MATATVDTTNVNNAAGATTAGPQYTTDRFDIAYGYKTLTEKDGTPIKNEDGSAKREVVVLSPEDAEELEKKGLFQGQMISTSTNYPANWEALVAYAAKTYTDDEGKPRDTREVLAEIVKLFNNGAKAKVMNRMRAQLTKVDETGKLATTEADLKDGVLELTDEITSGSKRVFLTEEQKTWRALGNLPKDIRENMWKVYLQNLGKDFYVPAE